MTTLENKKGLNNLLEGEEIMKNDYCDDYCYEDEESEPFYLTCNIFEEEGLSACERLCYCEKDGLCHMGFCHEDIFDKYLEEQREIQYFRMRCEEVEKMPEGKEKDLALMELFF